MSFNPRNTWMQLGKYCVCTTVSLCIVSVSSAQTDNKQTKEGKRTNETFSGTQLIGQKNITEKDRLKNKILNSTIKRPIETSSNPRQSRIRPQGIMECVGKAKKWEMSKNPDSMVERLGGNYSILLWFDLVEERPLRDGQCEWLDDRTIRTGETHREFGITLQYQANFPRDPVRWMSFKSNGSQSIELNRRAILEDRNMRYIASVLHISGSMMFWVENYNGGGGTTRQFGKMYTVRHVDNQHGYRFPETPY